MTSVAELKRCERELQRCLRVLAQGASDHTEDREGAKRGIEDWLMEDVLIREEKK